MFRKRRSAKVRPYRPILQVLEARNLLSNYLVDHLADDTDGTGLNGSLRYCITNAVDGDTITFGVTGTVNLTGALPDLSHNISINGPGANLLTVRRDTGGEPFGYRIFTVARGATVGISGLTIADGGGGDILGGGIYNVGHLAVSNCTISGNGALGGGGIFNNNSTATLTVNNCTIANNTARESDSPGEGGGIVNNRGTMTIANSTISGNISGGSVFGGGRGGGISNSGHLLVTNSTITGNVTEAGSTDPYGIGGGINDSYRGSVGTLTIYNSTIAGNTGFEDIYGYGLNMWNTIVPRLTGDVTSGDHNLIGVNPLLGSLQDNGGPTQTMALLAGSPALNTGDPAQLGVADQRGVVRSGGVNIGAYQASASAFVLTAPTTVTAGTPFDLTVKAVDTFGQVALGYTGTVTFTTTDPDPGVVLPADYTFSAADQGTHTFSGGFTLITPGDQTLTAADAAGSFYASAVVTVNGGGGAPGRHGGADGLDAVFAVLAAEWGQARLLSNGELSLDAPTEV
jgi:hypothetical protein